MDSSPRRPHFGERLGARRPAPPRGRCSRAACPGGAASLHSKDAAAAFLPKAETCNISDQRYGQLSRALALRRAPRSPPTSAAPQALLSCSVCGGAESFPSKDVARHYMIRFHVLLCARVARRRAPQLPLAHCCSRNLVDTSATARLHSHSGEALQVRADLVRECSKYQRGRSACSHRSTVQRPQVSTAFHHSPSTLVPHSRTRLVRFDCHRQCIGESKPSISSVVKPFVSMPPEATIAP